jgi:uridine kinase
MSPEGYYRDARDLVAVRRLLLDPLGPGGDRLYRTEAFDLERDEPVDQEPRRAAADAVLIVDGTFLQRPELAGCWDYAVFVDVPEAIAIGRGALRDAALLGGEESATAAHRDRYQRAFTIYESECNPVGSADVVIVNDPVEAPTAIRRTA